MCLSSDYNRVSALLSSLSSLLDDNHQNKIPNVITEISSAHGDKNSTSSAHSDKNSTSSKQAMKSFMALVTAFQKGQILYKN
jgi:hypothetical protein